MAGGFGDATDSPGVNGPQQLIGQAAAPYLRNKLQGKGAGSTIQADPAARRETPAYQPARQHLSPQGQRPYSPWFSSRSQIPPNQGGAPNVPTQAPSVPNQAPQGGINAQPVPFPGGGVLGGTQAPYSQMAPNGLPWGYGGAMTKQPWQ